MSQLLRLRSPPPPKCPPPCGNFPSAPRPWLARWRLRQAGILPRLSLSTSGSRRPASSGITLLRLIPL
eukprot:4846813-Pyramimonas_sp.AAC.1